MARLPEWLNVPSPRFWNRWRSPTNGASPIQCTPSAPIGVGGTNCLVGVAGLEVDHAVAADAAAGDRADGHDRRAVVRAAAAERRRAAGQSSSGSEAPRRSAPGRRRRQVGHGPGVSTSTDALGVELAGHRHQRRAGGVALAPHRRRSTPASWRIARTWFSTNGRFSSTTSDLVDRVGQRRGSAPGRRVRHRQLQDADAGGGEVVGPTPQGLEGAERRRGRSCPAHTMPSRGIRSGPDRSGRGAGRRPSPGRRAGGGRATAPRGRRRRIAAERLVAPGSPSTSTSGSTGREAGRGRCRRCRCRRPPR